MENQKKRTYWGFELPDGRQVHGNSFSVRGPGFAVVVQNDGRLVPLGTCKWLFWVDPDNSRSPSTKRACEEAAAKLRAAGRDARVVRAHREEFVGSNHEGLGCWRKLD